MSDTDTTSELRQDLEDFAAHYADYRQGNYDSNHEELDKRITILMRRIAAQKQRWERVAVLRAERNLLSSQISRHLFMDYAEQGAIDRINKIDAELAALDGVIGEL